MKMIFTNRLSLLVSVLLVSLSAGASTYYSKATATAVPSAAGKVYVKYNSAPSSSDGTTASKSESGMSAPTHKYYFKAETTDSGYEFNGWYDASSGGSQKSSSASYNESVKANTSESSATINRYARWTGVSYSIAFDGNGSNGGSMSNLAMVYGTAKNLTANAYTRAYTVTYDANGGDCATASATANYTFAGWATSASGTKAYDNEQQVNKLTQTKNAVVTLYALWNSASVTMPDATRANHVFEGWFNGDSKIGDAGAAYTPAAAVTLKAKWTEITNPTLTTEPAIVSGLKYNGAMQTLMTAGEVTGGTLEYSGDGVNYSAELPKAANAGDYKVYYRVKGDKYHFDLEPVSLDVAIAKVALSVTAKNESLVYGEEVPAFAVDYSGFVGEEDASVLAGTLAFACDYEQGSNVGEYDIIPSGLTSDNYAVTFNAGKLTVAKADAAFTTLPAAVQNLAYTGEAQTLITAGQTNDGTISYSLNDEEHYTTDLPQATEVGDYTVYYKVTGDANHNDLAAQTIAVSIAKARAVVTTAPVAVADLVYTGAAQTLINDAEAAVTGGTLVYSLDGENYNAELPKATDAKTYVVYYYAKADDDHSDSEAQTIEVTVAKAALTVTAEDKNVTYGEAAPAYTVAYSGFVGEEDASVLTGELAIACEYAAGSAVNTYAITPSGLTAANYELDFVAGTLTVGKAALTVTADDKNVTYGEAAPEYTVAYSGFVGEDTESVLTGELAFACEYAAGSAVNTYAITPSGLTAANYELDFVAGTLTVAKATLTVTADDKNVTYGEAAPEYTVAYSGFVGEDTESVLTGELAIACEYVAGSAVSTYAITPSGLTAANYELDFVAGTLTVAKAAPAVTAPVAIEGLAYTGDAQTLIAAGEADGGEMQYSLDGENYSTDLPKGTEVAEYTVYYLVIGDANHTDVAAETIQANIAKANAVITTAPTAAENLAYTGEAQALLATAGEATGGELQYSLDNETFAAVQPVGTNAGEYTVYYKVVADASHSDVTGEPITVIIAKVDAAITAVPTAAENLTYTGEAQALLATAGEAMGGELQYSLDNETFAAVLPVGTNADNYTVYYKVVGDQNHNEVAGESIAVSIAKADAVITTAPTAAENLTYTGEAQTLLATAGEATGGELQYSLDNETFAAELPTETNAGNYTVYYKVVGDQNHNDVAGEAVPVIIAKANAVITTAPSAAENLAYTGEAQTLISAGEATGGELQYSLDNETFAAELPTETNADNYTVYYKVVGDQNHNDVAGEPILVTIAKADVVFATEPAAIEGLIYTGEAQTLITAGEAAGVTVLYSLDGENFSADLPSAVNAGNYTVSYKVDADANHNAYAVATVGAAIAKAEVVFVSKPVEIPGLVFTGEAQTLITAGETADGLIEYSLDGDNYSAELPTATAIGDYTVYYRVTGDANHNDVEATALTARIAAGKASVVTVPVAAQGLTYTGEPQALLAVLGEAEGGELLYSLDGVNYAAEEPKATNAGEYTVYYFVKGDADHSDTEVANVAVTIAKADAVLLSAPQAVELLIENGSEQALVTEGTAEGGLLVYSTDGENFSAELPVAVEAGEYTVYYYVDADDNHNDTELAQLIVTIAPAGPATAVENTNAQIIVKKIIRNNQVLIIRDGKIYTVQGYEVR